MGNSFPTNKERLGITFSRLIFWVADSTAFFQIVWYITKAAVHVCPANIVVLMSFGGQIFMARVEEFKCKKNSSPSESIKDYIIVNRTVAL